MEVAKEDVKMLAKVVAGVVFAGSTALVLAHYYHSRYVPTKNVQEAVKSSLLSPSSAVFTDMTVSSAYSTKKKGKIISIASIVCGKVSAKNAFGTQLAPVPFMAFVRDGEVKGLLDAEYSAEMMKSDKNACDISK